MSQSCRGYRLPFTFACRAVENDGSPPHYEFRVEDTDCRFRVLGFRGALGRS